VPVEKFWANVDQSKQVSTETGLAWATVRQIAVRGTWKHLEA